MSRKKSKASKKKTSIATVDDRISVDMPRVRADIPINWRHYKTFDEGFEDPQSIGQSEAATIRAGTVARRDKSMPDIPRFHADGSDELGLLTPYPRIEKPPYGKVALFVGVLVSIYLISAILHPSSSATIIGAFV